MTTLGSVRRRLSQAIRTNEGLALAHRRIAERSPTHRAYWLALADDYARRAARHERRLFQLEMASAAGSGSTRGNDRRCAVCGRAGQRGLRLVDRLADDSEIWRCRNAAVCLKAAARTRSRSEHPKVPAS